MHHLQRACSAAGILEVASLQQAIGSLAQVRGGSTTNLCLRCGKPGATKLCGNGCSVARFCAGTDCERAAHASHRGALPSGQVPCHAQPALTPCDGFGLAHDAVARFFVGFLNNTPSCVSF